MVDHPGQAPQTCSAPIQEISGRFRPNLRSNTDVSSWSSDVPNRISGQIRMFRPGTRDDDGRPDHQKYAV